MNVALKTPYKRNISTSEKIWEGLNAHDPFYNQLVLDYEFLPKDIDWNTATHLTARANPGCTIELNAMLGWQHWSEHDRGFPVHHHQEQGALFEVLQSLPNNLSARKGIVCELRIIEHINGTALVFRSLHSAMDGRGTLHWAEEFLRAVNQQSLVGENNQLSDLEFSAQITQKTSESIQEADCDAITQGETNKHQQFFAIKTDLPSRELTAKLLIALKHFQSIHGGDKFRAIIPTDLRSYQPDINTTGNLTGLLHCEVNDQTSIDQINLSLISKLYKKRDAMHPPNFAVGVWMPDIIIKYFTRQLSSNCRKEGKYLFNANISNLGDLDATTLSVKGQQANNAFFIAPYSQLFPLFSCLCGFNNQTTISFAIPDYLQGNAPELMRFLAKEFDGVVLV